MSVCKRCQRTLRSKKSIEDGMGRTCKKKAAEEAAAEFEKMQITIFEVLEDGYAASTVQATQKHEQVQFRYGA